jgi:hypothetical protein
MEVKIDNTEQVTTFLIPQEGGGGGTTTAQVNVQF